MYRQTRRDCLLPNVLIWPKKRGGIHMPPIPTACQPTADEIANLQARVHSASSATTNIDVDRLGRCSRTSPRSPDARRKTGRTHSVYRSEHSGPHRAACRHQRRPTRLRREPHGRESWSAADIPAQVATLAVQAGPFGLPGSCQAECRSHCVHGGRPRHFRPAVLLSTLWQLRVSPLRRCALRSSSGRLLIKAATSWKKSPRRARGVFSGSSLCKIYHAA